VANPCGTVPMSDPALDSRIAFDIETLINECQPESILLIGDKIEPYVQSYLKQRTVLKKGCSTVQMPAQSALTELQQHDRYDVGIVDNALENLDKDHGGQLIAALRDLHTRRFAVVLRIGNGWDGQRSTWLSNDLLGFGMRLVNRYNAGGKAVHIYKYDIATYKKTPGWLNTQNWANPHLWNKYRW